MSPAWWLGEGHSSGLEDLVPNGVCYLARVPGTDGYGNVVDHKLRPSAVDVDIGYLDVEYVKC